MSGEKRPSVLLVTARAFPDGEDSGGLVSGAFAEVGADARWVCWDDPEVDWAAADLVVLRATWDYVERHAEFLAWTERVAGEARLVNGVDVVRWNSDKIYLAELADRGLDVVPTRAVDDVSVLEEALAAWGEVVLKPRVGAGGLGVTVLSAVPVSERGLPELPSVPSVVQPLVSSVRTEGEMSVYVIGGETVAQVRKTPPAGEILVHDHLGGRYVRVPLDEALAARALEAVALAEGRVGALVYARVDFLLRDGEWRVSELELIEPSLYLELVPENAAALAAACVPWLTAPGGV